MKTINAFIYPTPEQFDAMLRERAAFDPRNHISPDDTDGPVEMTDIERIVRDTFAEMIGIPPEAVIVQHRYLERYIPDNPHEFVWKSHSGKTYRVSKMASNHIFYALRMLFNHTVPPAFRVLGPGEVMKRYPDVPHWSPAYRQAAVSAFTNELNERGDLEGSLKYQFEDMQANTKAILVLGL